MENNPVVKNPTPPNSVCTKKSSFQETIIEQQHTISVLKHSILDQDNTIKKRQLHLERKKIADALLTEMPSSKKVQESLLFWKQLQNYNKKSYIP